MKNENRSPGFDSATPTEPTLKIGNTYFLGIGIDRYEHFTTLNNAVKDVTDIGNLLTAKFGFNTAEPYFHLLTDEEATRDNIIQALHDLVDRVKAEDRVLIYYSGHGLKKSKKLGYWLSVDAKKGRIGTYVTNSDVRDIIKAMNCRHVLLISDSCFSGSLLFRDVVAEPRTNRAFYDWERKDSRWVIASGKGVVPDGKSGGNSPFAKQFLRHLKEEEIQINVNSLANKVTTSIQYNYEQQPEASPLFGAGHDGGQFIFYRNGVTPAQPKATSSNESGGTKSGQAKRGQTPAKLEYEVRDKSPNENNASGETTIEKSKNILTGNIINVTGDFHVGDSIVNKTTDQPNETKAGNILYDIPPEMFLQEATECRVRIAHELNILVKDMIATKGRVIKNLEKISKVMNIELIDVTDGQHFKIIEISSEDQYIEDNDYTEWLFYVTPLKTGKHKLLIRVSTIQMLENRERKKDISFIEPVTVVTNEPTIKTKKMAKVPQSLEELTQKLNDLVLKDELKKALELFKKHLHPDSSKNNDIILLTSRFNSINKEIRLSTVSRDDAKRDLARIKGALTSYTEDLEEEDVQFLEVSEPSASATPSRSSSSAKLSLLEEEGLIEQAELLTKRINLIRRRLAIETDPSSQFKYEEEIKDLVRNLEEIKKKLG